ncbi:MAG: hypothetical protein KJ749_02900, partial [Planctomycetes bacterium]|nr:hypothetical protein [Planctomycetota bacterium]
MQRRRLVGTELANAYDERAAIPWGDGLSESAPGTIVFRATDPFTEQVMSKAAADASDWQKKYAGKVVTAEEAVKCVQHGQRVFIGSGAGEPQLLVEALSAREDLSDTEIVHILTLGVATYAEPRFGSRFRHNAYFIGPNVREAVEQGRADYTPIFLGEIPALFKSGRVVVDVALVQVSPPDAHGYCSYGVSTDIVKSATEAARMVIAEVDSQTPRALGDCFIHVRDIDY